MIKKYTLLFGFMALCFLQKTYPTIQWSGSSMNDVLDENLVIEGNCQMPLNADVYIQAFNADITVSLTHDAIIQANNSNDNSFIYGIYLEVIYPYSITINISHKLTFKGAAGLLDKPLAIYAKGNGTIQWVFEDDSDAKVKFTSDDNSGGTELWTIFSTVFPFFVDATPTMNFEIKRKGQVRFGPRSKWGYQVFADYNLNANTTFEHEKSVNVGFDNFAGFGLQIFNNF